MQNFDFEMHLEISHYYDRCKIIVSDAHGLRDKTKAETVQEFNNFVKYLRKYITEFLKFKFFVRKYNDYLRVSFCSTNLWFTICKHIKSYLHVLIYLCELGQKQK